MESLVQVGDNEQEGEKVKNSLEESIENEPTKNEIVAPSKEDTQKILYPHRLMKSKLDGQITKFLEVFKKLHINIPFVDVIGVFVFCIKNMRKESIKSAYSRKSMLFK